MRADGRLHAGDPGTIELRVPPRPENLALARLALAGVGTVAGASEAAVADLKLAVTEACTNSILHGYPDGVSGQLVVRLRTVDGEVEVEIEDDGVGFDPSDQDTGSRRSDGQGMGLMIIRSLMDSLEVESDDSGSRISFSKRASIV
jgi:anti-sigma regulatory factor (Ser/Thr protein kinase)